MKNENAHAFYNSSTPNNDSVLLHMGLKDADEENDSLAAMYN